MAASDARFSKALTPGTNITFTTNGASIAINAAGSSSIAATNVTGLGTAAYSNSTAFAPSTVTNLTAGQLATLASALTNVAFTNIWVTNGINAGSDSTGTYVRGGDGQPLDLSSGGIAYGYAYGGNGGTVNIAMGGYITNGGSGTSGPGDAGTVNIANGVYTAFLGGRAGLAGTVNIANGASGPGATGSAGTVNIATNNGNTYVGRLSAFGIISGNGSGLTNIASTNITGLGTAAYSNSTAFAASTVTNLTAGQLATIAAALTNASAFAPSTVTNLTAGQLATIAAAVTNNASPTLTGLTVGAQTALDVNGNGKFGGVGHTNGVLTGNGSGLTNIKSSAVVATNIITWFGVEQFANNWESRYNQSLGNNLPFISGGIAGFVYPINGTYIGPYFRTTPQMTTPYTNFNVTLYLIATNTTTPIFNPNHSFDYRLQDLNSTNCVNSSTSFTIGTLTNGINIKTSKTSFPPNFTNSFCQFAVNNGSSYFTNTVWCIGVKLEAY